MTIKYIAEDGTEFDTKEECIKHEIPQVTPEERININKTIETISYICRKAKPLGCDACPFHRVYNSNQCSFVNEIPVNWGYF